MAYAKTAEETKWQTAVLSLDTCSLCGAHPIEWAHLNETRGLSTKAEPWNTAALCKPCHYAIDSGKDMDQHQRRSLMDRAIRITHSRLAANRWLVLGAVPKRPTTGAL